MNPLRLNLSAAELNAIALAVEKETERRKYRHLPDFIRKSWPIIEGSRQQYRDNWHIGLICDHLEGVFRGEIPNLLINVPPGTMKSIASSVCFHPWVWAQLPDTRFLTASYGEDLALRDAVRSRTLVESEWFQSLWGSVVRINQDANQRRKYESTAGGWRMATSVAGRGTGEHPDFKIIDDPHNVKQAESDAERQTALDWYDLTLSTRGESRGSKTIIIMQRLHEKDLSGHIMAKEEFQTEWEHLCLPMRHEPGRYTSTIGADPREESGEELLWPELFTEFKVQKLERILGEYGAAGQLQQRPAPPGGGILKTHHFQLWKSGRKLPTFEHIIQSYDTAFKEIHQVKTRAQPDKSACSTWGVFVHPDDNKPAVLLLDAWEDHLSYPKLREKAIRDWGALYGGDDEGRYKGRKPDTCIIEDKASGQSLIQDMNLANIPVIPYNPGRADKIQRAHISAPVLELNRFYVIESSARPGEWIGWAKFMKGRLEKFPNDEFMDIVDTFTQAAIFIKDQRFLELDYVEEEEKDDDVVDIEKYRRSRNPYAA